MATDVVSPASTVEVGQLYLKVEPPWNPNEPARVSLLRVLSLVHPQHPSFVLAQSSWNKQPIAFTRSDITSKNGWTLTSYPEQTPFPPLPEVGQSWSYLTDPHSMHICDLTLSAVVDASGIEHSFFDLYNCCLYDRLETERPCVEPEVTAGCPKVAVGQVWTRYVNSFALDYKVVEVHEDFCTANLDALNKTGASWVRWGDIRRDYKNHPALAAVQAAQDSAREKAATLQRAQELFDQAVAEKQRMGPSPLDGFVYVFLRDMDDQKAGAYHRVVAVVSHHDDSTMAPGDGLVQMESAVDADPWQWDFTIAAFRLAYRNLTEQETRALADTLQVAEVAWAAEVNAGRKVGEGRTYVAVENDGDGVRAGETYVVLGVSRERVRFARTPMAMRNWAYPHARFLEQMRLATPEEAKAAALEEHKSAVEVPRTEAVTSIRSLTVPAADQVWRNKGTLSVEIVRSLLQDGETVHCESGMEYDRGVFLTRFEFVASSRELVPSTIELAYSIGEGDIYEANNTSAWQPGTLHQVRSVGADRIDFGNLWGKGLTQSNRIATFLGGHTKVSAERAAELLATSGHPDIAVGSLWERWDVSGSLTVRVTDSTWRGVSYRRGDEIVLDSSVDHFLRQHRLIPPMESTPPRKIPQVGQSWKSMNTGYISPLFAYDATDDKFKLASVGGWACFRFGVQPGADIWVSASELLEKYVFFADEDPTTVGSVYRRRKDLKAFYIANADHAPDYFFLGTRTSADPEYMLEVTYEVLLRDYDYSKETLAEAGLDWKPQTAMNVPVVKDAEAPSKAAPGFRKDDKGKPRPSLVPVLSHALVADVFTYGAARYGDSNWANVDKQSRYVDAVERHLMAFKSGETLDDGPGGSGKPHLAHLLASAYMLLDMQLRSRGEDDRFGLTAEQRQKWADWVKANVK